MVGERGALALAVAFGEGLEEFARWALCPGLGNLEVERDVQRGVLGVGVVQRRAQSVPRRGQAPCRQQRAGIFLRRQRVARGLLREQPLGGACLGRLRAPTLPRCASREIGTIPPLSSKMSFESLSTRAAAQ